MIYRKKEILKSRLKNETCKECFYFGNNMCTHEKMLCIIEDSEISYCKYKYFLPIKIDKKLYEEYIKFKQGIYEDE
jgi:hypothetical protein